MRSYRIYLYRHGATAANVEGRYIGKTDEVLSDEGIAQLLALSDTYEYPAVGRVYSSPLQRCLQTARVLYPGHTAYAVEGLSEYDFGDYENLSLAQLSQNPSFSEWVNQGGSTTPPNGEEMEAFHLRVCQAFDGIVKDMMKNNLSDAAIVTHGGVIMSLLGSCGLPRMEPTHWTVEQGKGYSLLINAQLWSNMACFEVCDNLPYQNEEEFEVRNYDLLDVDELRQELDRG